ncbi:hydrogenase expression/formation protein HypE [Nitrosomonas marina]|uniref:Hydrogenase expression/formation protein HypE n=1 Tax=Nitrosomonas marina TaxID=917 RepID=A0A1I0DCD1_9PROT|nr:hydrogenase expression/formation protein HypE [Nitrosomonas marina]SET29625.1 hydrogenase expression/formation protein HypE [Nitrosomonas marina]
MQSSANKKHAYTRTLDFKTGCVEMMHGSGGRAMAQLIDQLFMTAFDNDFLRQMNDQASFTSSGGRMVMATDSHVITPLFFPGGDIGCLSVHGTINDVVMAGAKPLYLSAGFILEEGLPLGDLKRIVESMAAAARVIPVPIITGDTKVVERGSGDGVFITTTGIGMIPENVFISSERAKPGDNILISGTIGDHGIAVMLAREDFAFQSSLESDTASLHDLVSVMVEAVPGIHVLRDPTRGGVAAALNEIAQQSGTGMMLFEERIPVKPAVSAACEFLGFDPMYVANEGKLIAVCAPEDTDKLLDTMRAHPLGCNAAVIGEIIADSHSFVQMKTRFGGTHVVDWLSGDQLPRIC